MRFPGISRPRCSRTLAASAAPAGALLLAFAGAVEAQQTLERYVRNLAELTYAIGEAEANPANTYNLTLE